MRCGDTIMDPMLRTTMSSETYEAGGAATLPAPAVAWRRSMAWGMSFVVHGALLAIVLAMPRSVIRPPLQDLERLVFVEPAPPPPALGGGATNGPAALEVAPADPAPPSQLERVIEAPVSRPVAPTKQPMPKPTVRARQPKPAVAPPVAAAPADAAPAAAGAAVEGGSPGGTDGGQLGGVVGGRGDEVVGAAVAAQVPVVVSRALPEYPSDARAKRLEGRVLMQLVVDQQGRVEDDVVILGVASPLDEAAIAAIRQWRFTPGRDAAGRPIRVRIEIPMRFQLR